MGHHNSLEDNNNKLVVVVEAVPFRLRGRERRLVATTMQLAAAAVGFQVHRLVDHHLHPRPEAVDFRRRRRRRHP